MHGILRKTAAEIESRLREFLSNASDTIRGIHLYFDEYWLEATRANLMTHCFQYSFGPQSPEQNMLFPYAAKFFSWQPDIEFRPSRWGEHCRARGFTEKSRPIIIRVILRDAGMNPRRLDLPNNFEDYPIVYQYRPPCGAYSLGSLVVGQSVGKENPNTAGTLGGFLQDSSGREHLVTCAHVVHGDETPVFAPGPADSSIRSQVAIVRHFNLPVPTPPGTKCNSRSMRSGNTVDVACAEVDSSIVSTIHCKIGHVNDINNADIVAQGMPVCFVGKSSGYRDAEVGSVCIWHEIEIGGQPHCFSDIFEITHPKPFYLNTGLARPGDSGAWIISRENLCTSWNGMLIGGDGAQAYACYAENLMNDLRMYSDFSIVSGQIMEGQPSV